MAQSSDPAVTDLRRELEKARARTNKLSTLDSQSSDGMWAALVSDFDRCQHGRHQGDACGPADACTGTSTGNPHLPPGTVIGYGLRGNHIVMPDREHKHDPAAWRQSDEAVTG